MTDLLSWAIGVAGDGLVSTVGGNLLLLGLIPIFVTAFLLWKGNASLPVSAMIIFVELGVLSVNLNNPGDVLFGGASDVGAIGALYFLVVAMTGFLVYHFLFKRTQMG